MASGASLLTLLQLANLLGTSAQCCNQQFYYRLDLAGDRLSPQITLISPPKPVAVSALLHPECTCPIVRERFGDEARA